MFTLGAIEHAVGTCDTTRPPVDQNPPVGGDITSSGGDAGIGTPGPDGGCCETGRAERSFPLALLVSVSASAAVGTDAASLRAQRDADVRHRRHSVSIDRDLADRRHAIGATGVRRGLLRRCVWADVELLVGLRAQIVEHDLGGDVAAARDVTVEERDALGTDAKNQSFDMPNIVASDSVRPARRG